jgi:dTDP-4-amino-4,6-dideoxygalactose transaminase
MKNFGFTDYDNVIYIGTNGKMNEVSAAMGVTCLESIDQLIDTNYRNYKYYQKELSDIPGVHLIVFNEKEKYNYQYVVLEIDQEIAGISRDQIIEILHAENILARRYFYPGCHQMEPYRSFFPHSHLLLPETERLALRIISLPTGAAVDPEKITAICQIIRLLIANSSELRKKWGVKTLGK